ncbi:MAG: hypothetical protein RMI74_07210, partial [Thermodesulfobacterium sp.]|nr:hypothetical protein [Thermodesulfobacterium sp.]
MFGRVLIPLILKDSDKEIQVREIEELKRLFNTENLPRLLSALDSGRLEQFFFAKRLDHIKEKIAQMRQNNEDAIEILNYVAEQIGAGKLSLSFKRASERSLTENFTEENQELYLILSSYSLTESSIKGNKKLI